MIDRTNLQRALSLLKITTDGIRFEGAFSNLSAAVRINAISK